MTVAKKVSVERIPVLVTTEHRGVFFGWLDPKEKMNTTLTLTRCRNCLRWSSEIDGFLGLAKTGPTSSCKIGAEAPEVVLHKVTSVSNVTEEGVLSWTNK